MKNKPLTPAERNNLEEGSVKGFTKKRLAELGIAWPTPKGWKEKLLGWVSYDEYLESKDSKVFGKSPKQYGRRKNWY